MIAGEGAVGGEERAVDVRIGSDGDLAAAPVQVPQDVVARNTARENHGHAAEREGLSAGRISGGELEDELGIRRSVQGQRRLQSNITGDPDDVEARNAMDDQTL